MEGALQIGEYGWVQNSPARDRAGLFQAAAMEYNSDDGDVESMSRDLSQNGAHAGENAGGGFTSGLNRRRSRKSTAERLPISLMQYRCHSPPEAVPKRTV